jgi:L-ascorbate metabolism protein UlaG (beta-lactamase superfamily)
MAFTLTWYGHASMGMDVDGHLLLVDPYFGDNPVSSITADQVEADFILISHGHSDHTSDALQIARRTGATLISNFEIVNWFEEKGIKNVHAQHLGGGFKYPFGYLKLTMALHGSAMPDGSYGGNPAGFLLTTNDGKKIYLACDTGLFGDMRLIGEEGIDLAVLPIGDNFTMGPRDALRAVKLIQPKHVIPVHFDTWELIVQDPDKWAKAVQAETNTQAHVLKPGQTFSLD